MHNPQPTAAHPQPHSGSYGGNRRNRLGMVALLFVALILVAPLSGWLVVTLYTPTLERDAYANLEAIATLKAEQLENWLHERDTDAAVLQSNEMLQQRVTELTLGRASARNREQLQHDLTHFVNAYGYN